MPASRPVLIDLDDAPDVSPAEAPPVPDPGLPDARAMRTVAAVVTRGRSGLVSLTLWSVGALAGFMLSVGLYDFTANLLASSPILGSVAAALVTAAVLCLLAMSAREALGFWRLGKLDALRQEAATARQTAALVQAQGVADHMAGLYATRADLRWATARLKERRAEVFDADGLLDLTETELLGALDAAARAEIETAARRVATVTALVPLALADVATALFSNLRMIRAIAAIYGGRAGTLGSLKLMRRVFGHLLATGALALGDDLIGSVAGGGLLGKLSRRFGEGVVNGALTARVGVAAMDLCRPMPFVALRRPNVTNLMSRALTGGLVGDGGPDVPA